MSASVRFLRPRRMPLSLVIFSMLIAALAIAAPPGADLAYDVAAEPKKNVPPPKGGRSEFIADCQLLGGELREIYGGPGVVTNSKCTYPKGNGSTGEKTCTWATNTCTVSLVEPTPTLSRPRDDIVASGAISEVEARQSATEVDKDAFVEACGKGGGQYADLPDGSFQCATGGAGTVLCQSTSGPCHYTQSQSLSATETIKAISTGELPARKDVATTKPANRVSGTAMLNPAGTPLAATPVPGSN